MPTILLMQVLILRVGTQSFRTISALEKWRRSDEKCQKYLVANGTLNMPKCVVSKTHVGGVAMLGINTLSWKNLMVFLF